MCYMIFRLPLNFTPKARIFCVVVVSEKAKALTFVVDIEIK